MRQLFWIMMVFFIPLVIALEECQPITQVSEIPCQITSTWEYDVPCSSHKAEIYNISGKNILNYTYLDYADGKCYFTWNITTIGSYKHYTGNGDTGDIIVEAKDQMAVFSIVLFLILINIGIFISPRLFHIKNEIRDYTVKRGIIISGFMFLGFNFFIMFVLAKEYLTILAGEMLFLFWLVETGIFLVIFAMMAFMLINRVRMLKEKKRQMSMGNYNE